MILMGRARRVPAMIALENAFMVGDAVGWKAAFIIGQVMASGAAAYLEVDEANAKFCRVVTKRLVALGGTGKERVVTFTIEEAAALGYLDPPKDGKKPSSWLRQPEVMCTHRCMTKAARRYYHDVISGLVTPDELRENGNVEDAEMQS